LHQFIPAPYLVSKDNKKEDIIIAEWEQKVIAKYEKRKLPSLLARSKVDLPTPSLFLPRAVKGFSAIEAKGNYLDYVQQWPVYGVSYFVVEVGRLSLLVISPVL